METVVIIGAGQAGAGAALQLRSLGFGGPVVLIGEEPDPPYERPELSKGYATGKVEFDKLVVLTPDAAGERNIDLRLGRSVREIDRAARRVRLGDEWIAYDHLIFATGGSARRIPLPARLAAKTLAIRTRSDSDALRTALRTARSVAVIGGGWLGLEAAATCRAAGLEVHVIEAAPRLCARVAPSWLSGRLAALHGDHGVTVHLGAKPAFTAEGSVEVKGTWLDPDLAILSIGMSANDILARQMGLACADGIEVDTAGRTADPAIFAIGDCARYRERGGERRESWQNANRSAERVARTILNLPGPAEDADWFWSNQFDQNIQILGFCADDFDQLDRFDAARGAHLRFFLREGCLAGCIGINAARDIGMCRRLLREGTALNEGSLANPSVPVKNCVLE